VVFLEKTLGRLERTDTATEIQRPFRHGVGTLADVFKQVRHRFTFDACDVHPPESPPRRNALKHFGRNRIFVFDQKVPMRIAVVLEFQLPAPAEGVTNSGTKLCEESPDAIRTELVGLLTRKPLLVKGKSNETPITERRQTPRLQLKKLEPRTLSSEPSFSSERSENVAPVRGYRTPGRAWRVYAMSCTTHGTHHTHAADAAQALRRTINISYYLLTN